MRIGAIGCGGHGTNNIWPHLRGAGLELVATCARHLDRAEAAASAWGVTQAFDDPAKMLDSVDGLDGVVVVVPPDQYARVIEVAIERGVPVFCDKPGADSADEAADLAARADEAGVPVVVGYQKRFGAGYQQAKALVDSGAIGSLTQGAFSWSMGSMGDDLRAWLFENPVHHFDLARFFFGDLVDVQVNVARAGGHALAISATSAAGAVVSLSINTNGSWFQHNEAMTLFGEGHAVVVDNVDTCIHRPPERPEHVWKPNYTVPIPLNSSATTMGFAPELAHFRAVVTDGAENLSSIASAAATLRLTADIARQAGV